MEDKEREPSKEIIKDFKQYETFYVKGKKFEIKKILSRGRMMVKYCE